MPPLIEEVIPDIPVTLLGSNPTERVQALESKRISVPGYIKDVQLYFDRARVFVAPLRYGAGMKGKIGQSMENGLPVVTANLGRNFINGINVMIAQNEQEFTRKTIELYQDAIMHFPISHYSPRNTVKQMLGKS